MIWRVRNGIILIVSWGGVLLWSFLRMQWTFKHVCCLIRAVRDICDIPESHTCTFLLAHVLSSFVDTFKDLLCNALNYEPYTSLQEMHIWETLGWGDGLLSCVQYWLRLPSGGETQVGCQLNIAICAIYNFFELDWTNMQLQFLVGDKLIFVTLFILFCLLLPPQDYFARRHF